jgi:chemotaxis protein histidine kinase CheA
VDTAHEGRSARCGPCGASFVIRWEDVTADEREQAPARHESETAGRARTDLDELEARIGQARRELVAARDEVDVARAGAEAANVEAESARADAEAARTDAESARARAKVAHAAADDARAAADAARAEADAARAEAERASARTRESTVQLREQSTLLAMNRQRLASLQEQDRLEQLAAADTEARVAAARRTLAETEQIHCRQLEALETLRRRHEETERSHFALASHCELLRAQQAELRESITELDAQRRRLGGETVAAEPRIEAPSGDLILPQSLAPADGNGRPADWLGGLRGLDLDDERGREFLERLAPLLDRHPDKHALGSWARDGRTVFLLCDTPDEAGRLKELIDVWGEVDPGGVAALAPAFQSSKSWFAASSRTVPSRRAVRVSRARAKARRHVAGRRSR